MSSIISLAIVDNNVDPKGIGRIRVKLTGTPTGPIEKSREYEPWDDNDPFIANPFLPTNINFIPEIGQAVKIIVYNPENDLVNREYIAGPFTTVHDFQSQTNARQVENTSYGSNVKKMNNVFSENGTYVKEVYQMEQPEGFEPSYNANVTLKLDEGNIAPDSEAQTAFNKYVK